MKLSDYIVKYLEKIGVRDVFMISGGLAMHLNDSFGKAKKIRYYCNFHEQASAMAAETYAKVTGKLGVCVVTGGPGGSNAVTGVVNMWQDSVPGLIISGQVRTEILSTGTKLRQLGEQELNIVEIVKSITKYAVQITDPSTIRYHLEKAVFLACSGRPGPVWLDIPLDIQAAEVDVEKLVGFTMPFIDRFATLATSGVSPSTLLGTSSPPPGSLTPNILSESVTEMVKLLKKSKRPIILAGNGIRIAGGHDHFHQLINESKVPVLTASCANDLMYAAHPLYFGNPGLIGDRLANFIIQNSDLVLAIGARLNFKTIGFNYKAFAREAKLISVDIDKEELNKKSISPYLKIHADAKEFVDGLLDTLKINPLPNYDWWVKKCRAWRQSFPKLLPEYLEYGDKYVNPYYFMHVLSTFFKAGDIVISCNGITALTTFLMADLKKNQRLIANIGTGGLGYDLPGAIGACIGNNKKPVTLTVGDGSMQFNLQELQTIVTYRLPIKIFYYNNSGYLSIRTTQNIFFDGNIVAADETSGVVCPDIKKIAAAFGINYISIRNHSELKSKIKKVYATPGPVIAELHMKKTIPLLPRIGSVILKDGKMASRPMEDMMPYLDRELFKNMMIVKPLYDQ